jgi:osmotically-inducible protein OsmY
VTRSGKKILVIALVASVLLFTGDRAAAWAGSEPVDREITDAIEYEFSEDPGVAADLIDVRTLDGIVTLTGRVDSLVARDRTERIAAAVKGVRGIVNRIRILGPLRTDNEIEEDVNKVLAWDPVTESWEIETEVYGRVVKLRGTVDSWQERKLAASVVKRVPGVKGIDNGITVDYKIKRPDDEIEEEIRGVLRWDVYVDDAPIQVTVDGGHVTLAGIAGSLAQKKRAQSRAWVAGVRSVDASGLQVRWSGPDRRLRAREHVSRPDAEIQDAVTDAFLYDPRVQSFAIDVEAEGGYVTLRGAVDNVKAKWAAADDAWGVVGVWGVDNKIEVRPAKSGNPGIENNEGGTLGPAAAR